jgi:hypothetical protein
LNGRAAAEGEALPNIWSHKRTQGQRIAELETLLAQAAAALKDSAKLLAWASSDVLSKADRDDAKAVSETCAGLCGAARSVLGSCAAGGDAGQ